MPYDLSACGLVTVSTSRFVACALGSHIFGNPNVSNDGTVIIGTVVNGTALSLTDGAAAHTYFKFNTTCGSIMESDSRLTFITTGAPNALVLTGGKAGIGTSSPSFTLDVAAPSNNQGIRINSVQAAALYMYSTYNDASNRNWGIYNNSNVFGDFDIRQSNAKDGDMTVGANSTSRLYIKNDGKVGIGTQSPSMTLSIRGGKCGDVNEGQGQLAIEGDVAYNATNGTTLSASGAGSVIVFRGKYDSAANYTGFAGIAGSKENTTDGNYGGNLRFYTRTHGANNPCEWMRITNTGNVGIGTASPTAKLHVNGSSQFDDSLNFASRGKMSWGGSPARLILTSCGSYNLALGTDDFVDRMTIQCGTGNVGIGTDSPVANDGTSKTLQVGSRLSIQNVIGTQFLLGTNTYYDGTWKYIACAKAQAVRGTGESGTINFVLSPQGTAGCTVTNMDCSDIKMIILESGNTGIGITSPTYRLHVNGTFYAAGSSQDYKQSICNYDTDSCMFMKLKPVTYQYKEEYCHLGKELKSGTQIGLIAEEVAETYPELAILVNEEENKVVRNVDYEKLSIILLSEVQKLRREVDDLKHKQ